MASHPTDLNMYESSPGAYMFQVDIHTFEQLGELELTQSETQNTMTKFSFAHP